MNSMTGYGSSQSKSRQLEVEVHVKSVNGRFLELRFHLPKDYAPFENEFRKTFLGWSRGTVDIYVHRRPAAETKLQSVSIRHANAKYWLTTLTKLGQELKLSADLGIKDILQMPYVMEHQERVGLLPGELRVVEKDLKKAAAQCRQMRQREGLVLKKELLGLLEALRAKVGEVSALRDEVVQSSQERLKARLESLDKQQFDTSRLALDAALMLDRSDVQEEVVRLNEHIKACRKLIQTVGEACGKKLDFFCQELLREVNTIGSKSQMASLTQIVVDAKSLIEKFREQVQNIE